MQKFIYTITDPVGIHARPAGILVKECKRYQSDITIEKGNKAAGTRARKATLELTKLFKEFRKKSIESAK